MIEDPARSARPVPGARRARHRRWTRISTYVTAGILLAFGGAAGWGLKALLRPRTRAEAQSEGTRKILDGLATQIRKFEASRRRLPTSFPELRDPDLDSVYDAEPLDSWGRPVEYLAQPDGRSFRLRSWGPDGRPDTPDDVVRSDP